MCHNPTYIYYIYTKLSNSFSSSINSKETGINLPNLCYIIHLKYRPCFFNGEHCCCWTWNKSIWIRIHNTDIDANYILSEIGFTVAYSLSRAILFSLLIYGKVLGIFLRKKYRRFLIGAIRCKGSLCLKETKI